MRHALGTVLRRAKLPLQVLPFMNQIDVSPVAGLCQTRSGLPSPLKSPTATIFHAVDTLGRRAALAYVLPFMNQMDRSPFSRFCQTRSGFPSLLKSPTAAIDHWIATFGSSAALS